jgi:26S proteasome regulatory subunit N2
MLNFFSLALTPTALIGVNESLKVPKSFTIISNAKPSLFKYPEFLKKDENVDKGKVETAVLSTTAKVKARVGRKAAKEGAAEGKDVDMKDVTSPGAVPDEEKKEGETPAAPKEPEIEPDTQELKNPSRVLKAQEKKI